MSSRPKDSQPRKKAQPKKKPWRRWLRALHRDAGYLAVGLTFVYAVSGLAVNHIKDWDPNFTQIEKTHSFHPPAKPEQLQITKSEQAASRLAESVLTNLGRQEEPIDVYAVDNEHLDITLEQSTLYVDVANGEIREEGQKERILLRMANWLHLNRGKKAWTYIADAYAIGLLFLATSGLLMIPGKKGIRGRGALLASVGALIPILYVTLSGGP